VGATRAGRQSRAPSADTSLQCWGPESGAARDKTSFVLTVPGEEGQDRERCIVAGAVRRPGVLLLHGDATAPPDLVVAWQDTQHPLHVTARAVLSEVFRYMQLWRMCYGFISCWFATWLVCCPADSTHRGNQYVSPAYKPDDTRPSVLAALAWLQHQALNVDPTAVSAYVQQQQHTGPSDDGNGADEEGIYDEPECTDTDSQPVRCGCVSCVSVRGYAILLHVASACPGASSLR
jgi:hypothetical protein